MSASLRKHAIVLLLLVSCGAVLAAMLKCISAAESAREKPDAKELVVLPDPFEDGAPQQMMSRYLRGLAQKAFDRRLKLIDGLKTPDDIRAYRQRLRQVFLEQLGGLPARTPLNARVVGKVEGDGCRIEKVLFESRPNHFVTANLFLPPGKPPYSAVLVSMGHYEVGKMGHQGIGIFLAQNGLAALVFDPIGQGERHQLLTPEGKPRFRGTDEHTFLGISSILVGQNTATYRVWDGIRALDYLDSRPDIVKGKYGCTGVSGGGTMTEYLMALDDRIECAAPGCAPTTFAHRLVKLGMGDAEQNICGQIALGLDHPDFFHLHAPSRRSCWPPARISSTSRGHGTCFARRRASMRTWDIPSVWQ